MDLNYGNLETYLGVINQRFEQTKAEVRTLEEKLKQIRAMNPKPHEWTPQQAITLYLTIEALLNQFEAENAAKVAKREPNTPKPE